MLIKAFVFIIVLTVLVRLFQCQTKDYFLLFLVLVDAIKDGLDVEIPGLERKLSEGEKINQINYKKQCGTTGSAALIVS